MLCSSILRRTHQRRRDGLIRRQASLHRRPDRRDVQHQQHRPAEGPAAGFDRSAPAKRVLSPTGTWYLFLSAVLGHV